MRSVSTKVLELKLELTPQQLQRVGIHPALEELTVGKAVTHTLRSTYFDTPDHRLHAQGISLRLRSAGDRWLQTVNGVGGPRNGISKRDEEEAVVGRPEPDIGAIEDGKVRRTIEKALKTSTLEPQFETVVTRTTRKLHCDKGDLELALDEGIVRVGEVENQVCEAALGLKAGSPESLLETAAALFSAVPIRLAEASKAERGYNLVLRRPDNRIAPQKARQVALRGNETCAEALGLFVESATAQIAFNRQAVLETDDPEAAHQLRIGLRRLRSALRVFRTLNDTSATRELEQYAGNLGRSVGKLRSADVLIENIYSPVAGVMKGERGFQELRAALLSHKTAKREEARTALCGDQWSRLQLYLLLWPQTVVDAASLRLPATDFAVSALRQGWKKLAKHGKNIEALSLEQRHDMRKALKGFRYATEFFGSLYEGRKVDKFVKDLRRLQDVFGYINDVAMAKELNGICDERCGDSRDAQRAAGYVLGWHDVHAKHVWSGIPDEWRRVKKRTRFWG